MNDRSPTPSATALNSLRQLFQATAREGEFDLKRLCTALAAANTLAVPASSATN